MTGTRSNFDPGFKLQVVQMIREQGLSVGQVCRDQNLVDSAARRWLAQYDAEQAGRLGIGKPLAPERQRVHQLERETQHLRLPQPQRSLHSGSAPAALLALCSRVPVRLLPANLLRKLYQYVRHHRQG